MTREEAKEIYWNSACLGTPEDDIIDKIYDEHESRVCENCKFFSRGLEGSQPDRCEDNYHLNGIIYKDFGCNKFQRKPE